MQLSLSFGKLLFYYNERNHKWTIDSRLDKHNVEIEMLW